MTKQISVCTRLMVVVCSKLYVQDSHGMHHDDQSTCIYKMESIGMQYCEKQAGVCTKLIEVVCSFL